MENKKIKKIVREEINDLILEKIVYAFLIIIYLGSWVGLYFVANEYNNYEIINEPLNIFLGISIIIWFTINLFPIFKWLVND